MPEAATASLIVSRAPADGIGDQYGITVRLDGDSLGSLGPGESIVQEVEAGEHRLRVSNTLMWKTVGFVAEPGEEIRFLTRNRRGFGTGFFAAMGAGFLYVGLERTPAPP